jgi:hypothetical protein
MLVCAFFLVANSLRLIGYEQDWQRAGNLYRDIIAEARQQVPDPRPGAEFCVVNLPKQLDVDRSRSPYVFIGGGIPPALRLAYGRDDLIVRASQDQSCDFTFNYNDHPVAWGDALFFR